MTEKELIASLWRLKVQTGSLACLGCGREHNCGIHGCAILREAVAFVKKKLSEDKSRSVMEYRCIRPRSGAGGGEMERTGRREGGQ